MLPDKPKLLPTPNYFLYLLHNPGNLQIFYSKPYEPYGVNYPGYFPLGICWWKSILLMTLPSMFDFVRYFLQQTASY